MRRKAALREFVVLDNLKDLQSACSSSMLIFLIDCYWHEIDSCVVLFCLFFLCSKRGFDVRSFGTGSHVKLPGPAPDKPNVYDFKTTYVQMYNDLVRKDKELYPPWHPSLCTHTCTRYTGDQISTHGSQHCVLFRNVLWVEILRAWRHVNPAAKTVNRCLTHVQGLYTHTHTRFIKHMGLIAPCGTTVVKW